MNSNEFPQENISSTETAENIQNLLEQVKALEIQQRELNQQLETADEQGSTLSPEEKSELLKKYNEGADQITKIQINLIKLGAYTEA